MFQKQIEGTFSFQPLILRQMQRSKQVGVPVKNITLNSTYLERDVLVDLYFPPLGSKPDSTSLLLINDGQDLPKFHFDEMLAELYETNEIEPLFCVGIHCSAERKMEYGTASLKDYKGRGTRAKLHQQFVFEELMPFIKTYWQHEFKEKAYAGFSLGGLSAKFYFTTGSLDETMDRNNNGIIDSIDDTLGLIEELEKKGYHNENDIHYVNYEDGKHDVKTWGRAMPAFLKWGWGRKPDGK